jgi:dihydrofolate synthase/folylpolyglutamate synthase
VAFETNEARYENILVGLRGRHQILNASVALQLAESLKRRGFDIPTAAIVEGIQAANHAGRLELHESSPPLLLDGAHNPSGAQALRSYLEEFGRSPLTLIFGAMKDKKLEEISAILFPVADRLILTRADNPRSAEVSDLLQLASGLMSDEKISAANSVREALALAKETTPSNGLICVTGSLYLLGEIKARLDYRCMEYKL